MADKCRYLDLFSEEHRKLHEEFTQCQDWSEDELQPLYINQIK